MNSDRALYPVDRVAHAYRRIEQARRPEVWIHLREEGEVRAEAEVLQARVAGGEALALASVTVAVKDNIDVAGLPSTAGCPAYAYTPKRDAPAVAYLRRAGAVILGKTNLDQFATGLVGTRSPYGAVRDARDPLRVSGGSSSGSAVAVALGMAELALGTDTAGSGRVPAAYQGVVAVKPTYGLLSRAGVVPACRSFDCVSAFAGGLGLAERALRVLAGAPTRAWPADAPLAAGPAPRVATFGVEALGSLSPAFATAFADAVARVRGGGCEVAEIDAEPFLAAGSLLYGGAFLAERYAAVGEFIAAHRDGVDPTVAEIILGAGAITAADYVADVEKLERLRGASSELLRGFDALLLPTTPFQPTIAAVQASPVEVNRRLGPLVSFCNLLDLCALSLPCGEAEGGQFGVTLYAPAFHDAALIDLARRLGFGGPPPAEPTTPVAPAVRLLVVGAHMRGEPLNAQLTDRGARFLGAVQTARSYRLFALATDPSKPGLVRTTSDEGAAIAGELWALPPAGLASLLAQLPPPMALGPVTLADGRSVTGFLCEPAALRGATEITEHGGWREHLARG